MNIAIIGYGKMGKVIEEIALSKGYTIVAKFDLNNPVNSDELTTADVAFEFTTPESAVQNIISCFEANIPVVSGTTGWFENFDPLKQKCREYNGTLFYASNYSLGMNILFEMNKRLAGMMKNFTNYAVTLSEIHHLHKMDAPSGTAITLANQIIEEMPHKSKWVNHPGTNKNEISILSERKDNISGNHTIRYESDVDMLEMTHKAKNRKAFASGAILAAEFILNKKGVYSMNDLLKF